MTEVQRRNGSGSKQGTGHGAESNTLMLSETMDNNDFNLSESSYGAGLQFNRERSGTVATHKHKVSERNAGRNLISVNTNELADDDFDAQF